MTFWAGGEARCQPRALALGGWERPAPSRLRATEPGVRQPERRVCSGEHLLCPHDTPASGPGRLVDTPGGGAWIHRQEEGLATRPWGWDQSSRGDVRRRASRGLFTPGPQGRLPHHSRLVGTPVAATAVSPAPGWGMAEGTEHVLGSCASPRRLSLQTGKPQGGYWLPGHRRGLHSASSDSGTLIPVPASASQLSASMSQSFMGSGGPEFRSRFLPFVSCVVLDKSLLLSKLPFPYL